MDMLAELAELTILDEGSPQAFRVRAYENAKRAVEASRADLAAMSEADLKKIDGIGKATATKIRELLDHGKVAKLEKLRAKFPPDVLEMSRVPGVGPKLVSRLRSELGVESVAQLRQAVAQQQLRALSGFGAKSEEKLARTLERIGDGPRRTPISLAVPLAERLVGELEEFPEVQRVRYCGSLRRMRETIGDLDIVVASHEPARVMEKFIALPIVHEVLVSGDTKTSVVTRRGLQVDLRVVRSDEFGAATLYFTGSKAHNIKLRQRAMARGWILNEYGLKEGERVIASKTEEAIYGALDLPFIPEVLREDNGEIESAEKRELPRSIDPSELLGDLHVHTTLSGDGRSPLEDVIAHARARGYAYLAITDHAENLPVNGVSREALTEQRALMARQQDGLSDIQLLHGCELNIGADGDLDYDADFRLTFDWCIAAVHSHFDLPQAKQTARIIKAMEDPAVNVIGHLSGRMIGKRPGIALDVDAIVQAAADTGTAIEINSALPRLDASLEVLRKAADYDVKLVISSDSHHVDEFYRMRWGTLWALRGWVNRDQVTNLWPRDRFMAWTREKAGAPAGR